MDQGVAEVPPCFVLLVPVSHKQINSVSNVSLNLHIKLKLVLFCLGGQKMDQDVRQSKQEK